MRGGVDGRTHRQKRVLSGEEDGEMKVRKIKEQKDNQLKKNTEKECEAIN